MKIVLQRRTALISPITFVTTTSDTAAAATVAHIQLSVAEQTHTHRHTTRELKGEENLRQ